MHHFILAISCCVQYKILQANSSSIIANPSQKALLHPEIWPLWSFCNQNKIFKYKLGPSAVPKAVICVCCVVIPFSNLKLNLEWLRAETTFKIWDLYFAQILIGIVEKQHVLTPFSFFFKCSHCLTIFPIFSIHVNWIVFYVTADLLKFYYQQTLHKIFPIITNAEHEVTILYEFGKWW